MAVVFVNNDKPVYAIIFFLAFLSFQLVMVILGISEVVNKLKK